MEGESETYPLWLTLASGNLVDALEDPRAARTLLAGLSRGRRITGREGSVVARAPGSSDCAEERSPPHAVAGVHANALFQVDDRYVLKVFRRVNDGLSIELELARALGERTGSLGANILGSIEYVRPRTEPVTLALLEAYVPNAGTAWHQALAELGRYYERVLTTHRSELPPLSPQPGSAPMPRDEAPELVRGLLGTFLDTMVTLGQRTAELHRTLLALSGPTFAPEPYSTLARRSEYQSLRNLSGIVVRQLREHLGRLTGETAADAVFVLERESAILKRFEPLLSERGLATLIRTHGDLQLDQVLFTGKDFVILDFEGDPDRSFNARRRKRSPLRDDACKLRSIDKAALVDLWEPGTVRETERDLLSPWATLWSAWMSAKFFAGYSHGAEGTALLPSPSAQADTLLDAFTLERALRDLHAELEWRGTGTIIPLRALARMLGSDARARRKARGREPASLLPAIPHRRGSGPAWRDRLSCVGTEMLERRGRLRRRRSPSFTSCRTAEAISRGTSAAARVATRYRFRLDGRERLFPDPASRSQPDGPHGPSEVILADEFPWTDAAWTGVATVGQVLYEMHIGTFTQGVVRGRRPSVPGSRSLPAWESPLPRSPCPSPSFPGVSAGAMTASISSHRPDSTARLTMSGGSWMPRTRSTSA